MSFALAARIVAAVCVVLFVILTVFPSLYTPTYGVPADQGVQFMTRRASPMFLGTAVVLWAAARSPPTSLRDAVAFGVAVIFAGIAVTGVLAFVQGIAAPTVLVAAAFECLAAGVLVAVRKN